MTYEITVESPFKPTETHTRARRDGAEYLFRRVTYDELKGRALLDRSIARRAMTQCEEAFQPDCNLVAVHVQETTIRFRKIA